MRYCLCVISSLAIAGCSTVQSRRDDPPILQQTTAVSLQDFQGCFAERTAKHNVQYLPRRNGGTFSMGAGPQRHIFWVVDVDDLGSERRVSVYAPDSIWGQNREIIPDVQACL